MADAPTSPPAPPSDHIHRSTVEVVAPDGHRFAAYRAEPQLPPIGAVVVIQEIFGVNVHIRSVADRFADAGFLALAPALFDRVERGVELGYDEEGMTTGVGIAWNLPLDQTLVDLVATCDAAADELGGASTVGATGFCFGGMLAAALACREADHLGAAVAYYPSQAAKVLADDVPAIPLLVHLGDLDQRVTVADGEALAQRWPTATFHRYDAGHGFNCDLRADYSPEASTVAWGRTVSFLGRHLAPGGPDERPERPEPTEPFPAATPNGGQA